MQPPDTLKAISSISQGKLIDCSAEQWPEIRKAVQEQAGKWIDYGDGFRATIALQEVARLDKKFSGSAP